MLSRSISATLAWATAKASASARIRVASSRRCAGVSCLESRSPSIGQRRRVASQALVDRLEPLRQPRLSRLVFQLPDQRRSHGRAGRFVLPQLRHHRLARQDVRQSDPGHVASDLPHHPGRQARHPVDDHHRALEKRRFQRRRSTGHQHRVGRLQAIVRAALDQRRDRRKARMAADQHLDPRSQRRISDRNHEPHRTQVARQAVGCREEHRAAEFDLRPAAARQHGDHRVAGCNAQALARSVRIGAQRDRLCQWMPHVGGRDAGARVETLLERKDQQHVRGGPPNPLDPLTAPRPDRRTDVLHRGHAGRAHRLLQAQVEVRRVDPDQHAAAALQYPPGQRSTQP